MEDGKPDDCAVRDADVSREPFDGQQMMQELADLAALEIRRLLRYILPREADNAGKGGAIVNRAIEQALEAFSDKLEDYVNFAVRLVGEIRCQGGTDDLLDVEGTVLQQQLRRALSQSQELAAKVEDADVRDLKQRELVARLRVEFYKEAQHWRQRCSALQRKMLDIAPADAEVINLLEDITFMSDSNFIDGEELHLLRSREDELREKHDIELQMLHRTLNIVRQELDQTKRELTASEDNMMKLRFALQSARKQKLNGASATGARSPVPTPGLIPAVQSAVARQAAGDGEAGRENLLQSKVDDCVIKLVALKDLQTTYMDNLSSMGQASSDGKVCTVMMSQIGCWVDQLHGILEKVASNGKRKRFGGTDMSEADQLHESKRTIAELEKQISILVVSSGGRIDDAMHVDAVDSGSSSLGRADAVRALQGKIRNLEAQLHEYTKNNGDMMSAQREARKAKEEVGVLKESLHLLRNEQDRIMEEKGKALRSMEIKAAEHKSHSAALQQELDLALTRAKIAEDEAERARAYVEVEVARVKAEMTLPVPRPTTADQEVQVNEVVCTADACLQVELIDEVAVSAKQDAIQTVSLVVEPKEVQMQEPRSHLAENAMKTITKVHNETAKVAARARRRSSTTTKAAISFDDETVFDNPSSASPARSEQPPNTEDEAPSPPSPSPPSRRGSIVGIQEIEVTMANVDGQTETFTPDAASGRSSPMMTNVLSTKPQCTMATAAGQARGANKIMTERVVKQAVARERKRWQALLPRTHSADALPGCGWPSKSGAVDSSPANSLLHDSVSVTAPWTPQGGLSGLVRRAQMLENVMLKAEEEADVMRCTTLFETIGARLAKGVKPKAHEDLEKLHWRVLRLTGTFRRWQHDTVDQHLSAMQSADAGSLETHELRARYRAAEVRAGLCWELQRQCLKKCVDTMHRLGIEGLDVDDALLAQDPRQALDMVARDIESANAHKAVQSISKAKARAEKRAQDRLQRVHETVVTRVQALLPHQRKVLQSSLDKALIRLALSESEKTAAGLKEIEESADTSDSNLSDADKSRHETRRRVTAKEIEEHIERHTLKNVKWFQKQAVVAESSKNEDAPGKASALKMAEATMDLLDSVKNSGGKAAASIIDEGDTTDASALLDELQDDEKDVDDCVQDDEGRIEMSTQPSLRVLAWSRSSFARLSVRADVLRESRTDDSAIDTVAASPIASDSRTLDSPIMTVVASPLASGSRTNVAEDLAVVAPVEFVPLFVDQAPTYLDRARLRDAAVSPFYFEDVQEFASESDDSVARSASPRSESAIHDPSLPDSITKSSEQDGDVFPGESSTPPPSSGIALETSVASATSLAKVVAVDAPPEEKKPLEKTKRPHSKLKAGVRAAAGLKSSAAGRNRIDTTPLRSRATTAEGQELGSVSPWQILSDNAEAILSEGAPVEDILNYLVATFAGAVDLKDFLEFGTLGNLDDDKVDESSAGERSRTGTEFSELAAKDDDGERGSKVAKEKMKSPLGGLFEKIKPIKGMKGVPVQVSSTSSVVKAPLVDRGSQTLAEKKHILKEQSCQTDVEQVERVEASRRAVLPKNVMKALAAKLAADSVKKKGLATACSDKVPGSTVAVSPDKPASATIAAATSKLASKVARKSTKSTLNNKGLSGFVRQALLSEDSKPPSNKAGEVPSIPKVSDKFQEQLVPELSLPKPTDEDSAEALPGADLEPRLEVDAAELPEALLDPELVTAEDFESQSEHDDVDDFDAEAAGDGDSDFMSELFGAGLATEVMDCAQQVDLVWDSIPSRVFTWLRLNLFQRQQATFYCSDWLVSELEEFPSLSFAERERLIKDFEHFLFEVMCLERPSRAVEQRRGLRKTIRKEIHEKESHEKPLARPTTCPMMITSLSGTRLQLPRSVVVGGPHETHCSSMTSLPESTSADSCGLSVMGGSYTSTIDGLVQHEHIPKGARVNSAASAKLHADSMASLDSLPGTVDEHRQCEMYDVEEVGNSRGIGQRVEAPVLHSDMLAKKISILLGFDVTVAHLDGVQQDVLCVSYAAGELPLEVRWIKNKDFFNSSPAVQSVALSRSSQSCTGGHVDVPEVPLLPEFRMRLQSPRCGVQKRVEQGAACLGPFEFDEHSRSPCNLRGRVCSRRRPISALPSDARHWSASRKAVVLVSRLEALRCYQGARIPPNVLSLLRTSDVEQQAIAENFLQVAGEEDHQREVAAKCLGRLVASIEVCGESHEEHTVLDNLTDTVFQQLADGLDKHRLQQLELALDGVIAHAVQRRAAEKELVRFAFRRLCTERQASRGSRVGTLDPTFAEPDEHSWSADRKPRVRIHLHPPMPRRPSIQESSCSESGSFVGAVAWSYGGKSPGSELSLPGFGSSPSASSTGPASQRLSSQLRPVTAPVSEVRDIGCAQEVLIDVGGGRPTTAAVDSGTSHPATFRRGLLGGGGAIANGALSPPSPQSARALVPRRLAPAELAPSPRRPPEASPRAVSSASAEKTIGSVFARALGMAGGGNQPLLPQKVLPNIVNGRSGVVGKSGGLTPHTR